MQPEGAGPTDAAYFHLRAGLRRRDALGVRPCGRHPEGRRDLIADAFMRALVIVAGAKCVEAPLLCA